MPIPPFRCAASIPDVAFCLIGRKSTGTILKSGSMQSFSANLATATQLPATLTTDEYGRAIWGASLPDGVTLADASDYEQFWFQTGITPALDGSNFLNDIASVVFSWAAGQIVSSGGLDADAVEAIVAAFLIGNRGLSIASPVDTKNSITIDSANDYSASDGTPIRLTIDDYGGPSVDSVNFYTMPSCDYDAKEEGTWTPLGSASAEPADGTLTISIALTKAEIVTLNSTAGKYNYVYKADLISSSLTHTAFKSALTMRR